MKLDHIKALLKSKWGRVAIGLSIAVKVVLLIAAATGAAAYNPCIRSPAPCVQRHEAAPVGAARMTEEPP